jgi:hypothetical protein
LDQWLAVVASAAATNSDAPVELLGEYLIILADAALSGRRRRERELAAVRRLGGRAAEQGVDANQAVDLYSRRLGGYGRRFRRSSPPLASARRSGPPPRPFFA